MTREGSHDICQTRLLEALFAQAILAAISNRPCKLATISWQFVTLKLKKIASNSPQNSSMFEIAASLQGRFGIASKKFSLTSALDQ